MNAKALFSAISALALCSCFKAPPPPDDPPPPPPPDEPKPAFLVSALQIPATDEEVAAFGQDYTGDGVVDSDDNSLLDLAGLPDRLATIAQIAQFFGFDIEINIDLDLQAALNDAFQGGQLILGVQLNEALLESNGEVFAQGAFTISPATVIGATVPNFDGQDELQLQFPIPFNTKLVDAQNVSFETEPGDFFFTLPVDGAGILPLDNTVFTGSLLNANAVEGFLDASGIQAGTFSGTIRASEFATQLQGLGAAFAGQSPELLEFLDDNGNGQLDAVFNRETGTFDENELSLIFDIELDNGAPGDPSGFIGDLFRVDVFDANGNPNQDGILDSMGIGLGLTAVAAEIPPP